VLQFRCDTDEERWTDGEKESKRNDILIGVAGKGCDFPTGGFVINGIVHRRVELRNTAID
jgi:hypothetical protein